MSASFDPNHVTKLGELYDLVTGIWTKCKNLFATKSEVPSKTSDLQNDSGFITSSDIPAQQQANWNESDNTKPSFIQNKPSIPAAQVQSDWNQSDNTQVDFIKNKPSIPAAQVQSDWNQSDNTQVDFIKNKPTIPTTDQTYNASSTNPQSGTAVAGAIANVRQVPASTSSDSGKVLKVDASGNPEWDTAPSGLPASTSADEGKLLGVNSSGNPEWQAAPTFTQEQADWTESDSNDPAYIKNKPTEQTLVAGVGISITEANNQVTIGCNVQAPVQDVTYGGSSVVNAQGVAEIPAPSYPVTDVTLDGTSVVSNGVAALTSPTVDQTYNSSSTNAQSGTAVAGAIANVKQVPASTSADEGKVLKVDSSGNPEWGAAPASQVQADWTESDSSDPSYIQNKPVEQTLVAGTNITITEANNQVTIGASFTQAQADWNQSDNTAADFIKNKPSIPAAQVQSDWSQSDNTQVDFIKNKPNSVPIAAGTGISATVSGGSLVIASDETVLWSGDSLQWNATELTLSESLFNFEKITVVYSPFSNVESQHMETFIPRNTTPYAMALSGAFLDSYNWTSSSTPYLYKDTFHWNAAGTKITLDMVWLQAHSSTTWSTRTDARMYKVIGINRKPAS